MAFGLSELDKCVPTVFGAMCLQMLPFEALHIPAFNTCTCIPHLSAYPVSFRAIYADVTGTCLSLTEHQRLLGKVLIAAVA